MEYYDYEKLVPFETLKGKVFTKIEQAGATIKFYVSSDKYYLMAHDQECCETVWIEDICGYFDDLIGSPILVARESTSSENPEGVDIEEECQDSFTWTFYSLATVKGYVDIRWYGESNGYYSESVELYDYT